MDFLDDQENDPMGGMFEESLSLRESINRGDGGALAYSNKIEMQVKRLQVDALKLRRTNKELELQKRELDLKLSASQALLRQRDLDAASLKASNQELRRQVEALQNQRFSEVEELVYLRWVNACLRYELASDCSLDSNSQAMQLNKVLSPTSQRKAKRLVLEYAGLELARTSSKVNHDPEDYETSEPGEGKPNVIKKLSRTWSRKKTQCQPAADEHGISRNNTIAESFQIMSRTVRRAELSARYPMFKDRQKLADTENGKATYKQFNAPRLSPSSASSRTPPPPPPPPMPSLSASSGGNKQKFQRAPQVIELYHAMMRRNMKKDGAPPVAAACINVRDARNNMIGEIESKSPHMIAIKADVEKHRELVVSLAAAVRAVNYKGMDDVLAFVPWLDEQLSSLVDERAVLKHFDWPEAKADALRESASDYRGLKELENELTSFEDDYGMKRNLALNRMQALMERTECSIYTFLRTSDRIAARYREIGIPTRWMLLDGGLVGKIKRSSVKLAEKFMKRVLLELDGASNSVLLEDFLLLQGVRFAFRAHQFAGGFDEKSMQVFEELRNRARKPSN